MGGGGYFFPIPLMTNAEASKWFFVTLVFILHNQLENWRQDIVENNKIMFSRICVFLPEFVFTSFEMLRLLQKFVKENNKKYNETSNCFMVKLLV